MSGPLLLALALLTGGADRVTVIGFADTHAHAVPFRSEGQDDRGGAARLVGFLRAERAKGPVLVLSGGDTMNAGTPTWSDEYRCLDWPWLNGLVDAMALGNHELDYGAAAFAACLASARYPVLSANVLGPDGKPFFTVDGKPYLVREVNGRRIGAFALAGADMARLVKPANLPAGVTFDDPVAAARAIVAALRNDEHVDAVVLFGHQHAFDDEDLARAVPGIDLVLGTHSHLKRELGRVPGTATWMVSPFQYGAYVSRVELVFEGRKLVDVAGGLVPMDAAVPAAPDIAARVAELQRQLVARRPERFEIVGRAAQELEDTGISSRETTLGDWATEVLRRASGARAFLSTASSFRAALGPGPVTVEQFFAAFPYPNRITTATLTGRQVQALVELIESRRGTDSFSQQSGLRWTLRDGKPVDVRIRAAEGDGDEPVRPEGTYRIATTDFQAYVAGGYRELFAQVSDLAKTELDVHATLRAALARGDAAAELDGRSGGAR